MAEHLLGLFYPGESDHGIKSLRDLADDEYGRYTEACSTLGRFFKRHSYVLALRMHKEFIRAYQAHARHLADAAASRGTPQARGDVVFDINSRLALWLEAFRLFLNHTETDLKRRHGEDSAQWRTWATSKGWMFDHVFAYRFMYHLRNFLHVDMPRTDIKLTSAEVSPGVVETELEVTFRRDDLLRGKDWHARVAADLAAMPERFAVLPLALDLQRAIDELLRTLIEMELPGARSAATVIDALAAEALSGPGVGETNAQPIVLSGISQDPDTKQLRLSIQHIPVEWIDLVREAENGRMTIFGSLDDDV